MRLLVKPVVARDHLASSGTLDFARAFADVAQGEGTAEVPNSLADEFVDASLRLVRPGGHFTEMDNTDVCGTQARLIGKRVPTVGRPLDHEGTVLVTGGIGGLGSVLSRHLVRCGAVTQPRRGDPAGPRCTGGLELPDALSTVGARVTVIAGDLSQRADVTAALEAVPADNPPTAVGHADGVLDEALLGNFDHDGMRAVLDSEAAAPTVLHELTERDLNGFVLSSSALGVFGAAGQVNYAAADTLLDGLAQHRRSLGFFGMSVAWGLRDLPSAMTARLDQARMAPSGLLPVTTGQRLAMFDEVAGGADAQIVAVRPDLLAFAELGLPVPQVSVRAEVTRLAGMNAEPVAPEADLCVTIEDHFTLRQGSAPLTGRVVADWLSDLGGKSAVLEIPLEPGHDASPARTPDDSAHGRQSRVWRAA